MFFISKNCKAQFYNNSPFTFWVKKECIDFVFKIKKGVYLTVSVYSLSEGRVLLACEWGNFWNRMKNMRNRKEVLSKLNKTCPFAADIFQNAIEPHFAYLDKEREVGAVVIEMEAPIISNNISDFLHKDIVGKAMELMEYNLNLLVELEEKCPFPQWKIDLANIRSAKK